MASMISFMTVGIGDLKWVGGICSAIVFATYMYVIILIPIFMSFGKDKGEVSPYASSKESATPSPGATAPSPAITPG